MLRKYTLLILFFTVLFVPVFAEDEENVVEGSEVSGDIIVDDDAALAEDIFGLEGGDFVSDTPPPTDETTTTPTEAPTGKYTIQVFATYSMGKAGEISDKVKSKLSGAETFIAKEGGTYKVRVGSYAVRDDADRSRDKLRTLGFHDAWVVTLK
ncbi:MAG: SPOR domain-containing protein [bacterium]|nr:SPOR domain-containing protein [bacterium]